MKIIYKPGAREESHPGQETSAHNTHTKKYRRKIGWFNNNRRQIDSLFPKLLFPLLPKNKGINKKKPRHFNDTKVIRDCSNKANSHETGLGCSVAPPLAWLRGSASMRHHRRTN